MRTKVFLWTLMGCLVAPSIATAQDVYFSMGNDIRKLGRTNPVFTSTLGQVGDLALCAGDPTDPTNSSGVQYLYFVERTSPNNQIRRLDIKPPTAQLDTSFTQTGSGQIGEIRLDKDCNVVVGTGGLAIAFDGSSKLSANFTASGTIVGLGVANGGDGSVWPSSFLPPPANRRGTVCASASNKVVCAPKPSTELTNVLATFGGQNSSDRAQYFEFLTNDVAIVATSVDPTAAINGNGNGFLWQVNGPSSKTQLFKAPKNSNNQYPPIVGVAVGPSSSNVVQTASSKTHRVNFGPVGVDVVTPAECRLKIQLHQRSWEQTQSALDSISSANSYQRDPGDGGESWVDVVEISKVAPDNCGLPLTNGATVGLSQFNDPTNSKAVVRCHGTPCEVITEGNFPYSTPDDPRDSGTEDDFSEFFTAQVIAQGNAGDRDIVFANPLNNEAAFKGAVIPPAAIDNASEHSSNSGLSIRFSICSNANCSKFADAEQPNTPETGAGLSVSAIDENGVPITDCDVDDSGGANPDRPVFRTSEGKTHTFNLHSPLIDLPGSSNTVCSMANLPAGASQLFVAGVFSYSDAFNKTAIVFRLVKQ